ncbi:hypothetical protein GGI35DRAFT_470583 [Trichoderma velutinum]
MDQQSRGVVLNQVNTTDARDGEPDVDIIAIHGLDTKSPETWTWRSQDGSRPNVNWLADPDMLPSKMKRARIFTCDWPAELFQESDSIPWTVREFARRLLAGIHNMRFQSTADGRGKDRPIVFIASCLGGIILMEALTIADNPQSDYISIRKATRGIVFLATPFRGTAFQDIASWAEPVLKTWALLGKRSVTQLLDSVKRSTFYLEELLVNSSSATLDIDSNPLPLERSHVMMNKFAGPDDTDYITVTGRLDALLQLVRDGLQQVDAWIRDKIYTEDRLQIERLSGQRLPMDQCYINLVIVERLEEKLNQSSQTQSLEFLFATQNHARRTAETYHHHMSQIELTTIFNDRQGRDGCFYRGTWKEWNKIFNRILWVPLRNLKLQERMRLGYNYECLFSDEYFSLPEDRPELAKILSKAIAAKNNTTLFLLDGLDEVTEYLDGEDIMSRFLQDLLKQPNVIITSRPSAKPPPEMDLELETLGFDDKQVQAYLDADITIKPKVNKIKSFLQEHRLLRDLVLIPVQLDALCYIWDDFESGISPDSMTSMYQSIEQNLWKKDAVRLERIPKSRAQSALAAEVENRVEAETKIVEILAFHGMYHDIINFTSKHLEKIVRIFPPLELTLDDTLGRLSFLRTSDPSSNFKIRSYHFIHLTFQEYFAARYFVQHWASGEQLSVLELGSRHKRTSVQKVNADIFLRDKEYSARYNIFWRFVAGLLHTEYEDQPRDLWGPIHQRPIMHCLSEVVPSDGMETFAPLRIRLEEHLSQWLEFECRFRGASLLIWEIEFPEAWELTTLQLFQDKNLPMLIRRARRARRKVKNRDIRIEALKALTSTWEEGQIFPVHLLQAIEAQLTHQDKDIREIAFKALPKQPALPVEVLNHLKTDRNYPKNITEAMALQLKHRDEDVRKHAASALKHQSVLSNEILEALATQLQDQNHMVKLEAARALSSRDLSEEILEAIAALLTDQSADIRLTALKALQEKPALPERILKIVILRAYHDNNIDVRIAAVIVLGTQSLLSEEILEAIVARVGDSAIAVQKVAMKALRSSPTTLPEKVLQALIPNIYDKNGVPWQEAVIVLQGNSALPNIILNDVASYHDSHTLSPANSSIENARQDNIMSKETDDSSTSTIQFTPKSPDPTIVGELWDGRRYTVPWPGNKYNIFINETNEVICSNTLGALFVQDIDHKETRHYTWLCVEKNGYFGFVNTDTGKFMGHNNANKLHSAALHQSAWEYMTVRKHPQAGYELLMPYWWHTLKKVANALADHAKSALHHEEEAKISQFPSASVTDSKETSTDASSPVQLQFGEVTYTSITHQQQDDVFHQLSARCHSTEKGPTTKMKKPRPSLADFQQTPLIDPSTIKRRAVVIDCEMAETFDGSDKLISLCAINFLIGETLVNSFISPSRPIANWRTKIHGIDATVINEAATHHKVLHGWAAARRELWKHIDESTILIGQTILFDFEALRLIHMRVVDSAILATQAVFDRKGNKNKNKKPGRRWGLQELCEKFLGIQIRNGDGIHNSMEDVLAAREVVLQCLLKPEDFKKWADKAREDFWKPKAGGKSRKKKTKKPTLQSAEQAAPAFAPIEDYGDFYDSLDEDGISTPLDARSYAIP